MSNLKRRGVAAFTTVLLLAVGCTGDDSAQPAASPGSDPTAGTGTAASPSPSGTVDAPEPPRRVSVVMSGDVLIHTGVWESAAADAAARGRPGMDFRPMFASLKPVYEAADLAICHMEVPLAPPGGPYLNYPLFSAPPEVVTGLRWAGIDACTTASNHSLDQGLEGLLRTVKTLEESGLEYAGTAVSRKDARTPTILDVNGVSVALLSYTYGTNGLPIPSEARWSVPLIDVDKMLRDARRARDTGAEIVLVALHVGTEYMTAPNEQQLEVVDALTRSPDIDLVYGHHAHVPQPFTVRRGTWVAYGLGNFVAQQSTAVSDTYRGVTARFNFVEQPDGSFEVAKARFTPTMITPYTEGGPPMRVLNAPAALRDPDTDPSLLPSLGATIASVREDVFSLDARRHGLRMTH